MVVGGIIFSAKESMHQPQSEIRAQWTASQIKLLSYVSMFSLYI